MSGVESASKRATLTPVVALGALVAFMAFVTSWLFLPSGVITHDTQALAPFFIEAWRSVSQDGTFPLWFAHNQFGFPAYFYTALGDVNGKSPPFVAVTLLLYVLHLVGASFNELQLLKVYVVYTNVLIPALLVLTFYWLAAQIVRATPTRMIAAVVMAFSPAVALDVADIGLSEPLIYASLFMAAALAFLRSPRPVAFWRLAAASGLAALALSYAFMISVVIMVPIAALFAVFRRALRRRLAAAVLAVPAAHWALAVVFLLICALPTIAALRDAGEFVRGTTGSMQYEFFSRANLTGNPLELALAGVPGIQFVASPGGVAGHWMPWSPIEPTQGNNYFGYLGLAMLPLAIVGALFGRPSFRLPLTALAFPHAVVILLNALSPFMMALMALPTPLQANSHFGDAYFRSGGFVPIVLLGALGAEALIRRGSSAARAFLIALVVSLAWSLAALLYLRRAAAYEMEFPIPFVIALAPVYLLVAAALLRAATTASRLRLVSLLAVVLLVDTATALHWQINVGVIGFNRSAGNVAPASWNTAVRRSYVDTLLRLKPMQAFLGFVPYVEPLPEAGLFPRAHTALAPLPEDVTRALGDGSLPLHPDRLASPAFAPFAGAAAGGPAGSAKILTRRANRIDVQVEAQRPALLFLKDSAYPHWRAYVDGQRVEIADAFSLFKVVPVPAGSHVVHLSFMPRLFVFGMIAAYLALFGMVALAAFGGVDPVAARLRRAYQTARAKPAAAD